MQDLATDSSQKTSRLTILEKEVADLKSVLANKDEEIKNLSEKSVGRSNIKTLLMA